VPSKVIFSSDLTAGVVLGCETWKLEVPPFSSLAAPAPRGETSSWFVCLLLLPLGDRGEGGEWGEFFDPPGPPRSLEPPADPVGRGDMLLSMISVRLGRCDDRERVCE
jgi:hypothetical protein